MDDGFVGKKTMHVALGLIFRIKMWTNKQFSALSIALSKY